MNQAIFQALKLDLEYNWQSRWVIKVYILTGADSNSFYLFLSAVPC